MPHWLFTDAVQIRSRLRVSLLKRHRIISPTAPWMTTTQSLQSEPAATRKAMRFNCFQKIRRTGWLKTTTAGRPAKKGKDWRERVFVESHQKSNKGDHQGARI